MKSDCRFSCAFLDTWCSAVLFGLIRWWKYVTMICCYQIFRTFFKSIIRCKNMKGRPKSHLSSNFFEWYSNFSEIGMQFLGRKVHTSIWAFWSNIQTNKEVTAFWKSCKMHCFKWRLVFNHLLVRLRWPHWRKLNSSTALTRKL